MSRWIVLLFGVSATAWAPVVSPPVATAACATVLGQAAPPPTDYHRGELVNLTHVGRIPVPKGSRVFRLGEGGEAVVYRVEPPGGDSYVLRLEKTNPDMPIEFFRRNMDFVSEVLSDPESGDPLPGDKSFKVARCEKTADGKVLRLEDVRGTDLETLVERLGADHPEAKRLIALFDARSADLVARSKDVVSQARGQTMRTETTHRSIPYTYQSVTTGQSIRDMPNAFVGVAIVWRNVIVDPKTLEMTIIDPY